jgi:hypothetical protein
VIGWVKDRLFTVIFEVREDNLGEYCHLVMLWRSTRRPSNIMKTRSLL